MFRRNKKRVANKGQFTLFVIIGLMILFAFAFLFYARARIATTQLLLQADTQIKNYINQNSINQYVTSCLDAVSDEIFIKAAMQGGTLDFEGKTNNSDYIQYFDPTYNDVFNVSIVIRPNNECPVEYIPPEDYIVTNISGQYPFNCRYYNEYVRNLPQSYMSLEGDCRNTCNRNDFRVYSGFFGISSLPMLCDYSGANRFAMSGDPRTTIDSCDYYAYYNKSMQQLLQEEITNEISKCINFTDVLEKTPSNITKIGDVNASIIFVTDGFIIKLQYPFTVVIRNSQPVTKLVDFTIRRDIKFKELYEYAYEIANNDIKNAAFDKVNYMRQVYSWSIGPRYNRNIYSSNFNVNVIREINGIEILDINGNHVDIVQVIDNTKKILGLPLTITFAVQNRMPVLDWVSGNTSLYDLGFTENQLIRLTPFGYDPDDEPTLRYTYEGWMEDYTDSYNWDDPECSHPDDFSYVLTQCTHTSNPPSSPHMWNNSQEYRTTGRIATYTTTHDDIGLHTVRITITDRDGLEDYQDVRILVFDLPQAVINVTNGYDDVPSDHASYEDIYILNGSDSTIGVITASPGDVQFSRFTWEDPTEPFIHYKIIGSLPSDKELRIPTDLYPPDTTIDIMNIKGYMFSDSVAPTTHDISLTVDAAGTTNTHSYPVTVVECLPHYDSEIPPYPFDTLQGYSTLEDHLQARHECCNENTYTYKGTGETCYEETTNGGYANLIDYSTLQDIEQYIPNNEPLDYYNSNDIFRQEITGTCSGERGNVCTGNLYETRTVDLPCQDYNIIGGAFAGERCSGPPPELSESPLSCFNYPQGQTFEGWFEGGTGICTTDTQCASREGGAFQAYDNSYGTYSGPYKYRCNGQCDYNGGCTIPVSCTCDSSCDASVDSYCEGAQSGWSQPLRYSCSLGNTGILDWCNDCESSDTTFLCYAYGDGCTADIQCSSVTPGTTFNTAANEKCVETNRLAMCNSTCNLVRISSDTRCGTVGEDCYGASRCNLVARNSRISTNGGTTEWCDISCGIQTCNGGQTFNAAMQQCNTDCNVGGCTSGTCCRIPTGCGLFGIVGYGRCY